MNSIENNICEAIQIITSKAIAEAEYDRTIQATIVECLDAAQGMYSATYQDSKIYVYTDNTSVTYTKGTLVYVLIPGNNLSNKKQILGAVNKLGVDYVSTIEGEDAYDINGINCIDSAGEFGLSSYSGMISKVLYSKEYEAEDNLINLDIAAVEEYIKNSDTIICGGNVRTALPTEQQYQGNYGMIFALNFLDNTGEEEVTRYYIVDVDKMTGQPYKLVNTTRQVGIFEIDNENFIDVDSISIFSYGFPNSADDAENDIFISDLELCGTVALSSEDLSNYALSLRTPQGTYFDENSLDTDTRTIEAYLRIKGKVTIFTSLSFYWFMEDASISSKSTEYNKYGGQGWRCLNDYNIIQAVDENDPEVVEWVPASNTFTVAKTDIGAKEVKYKCAVVYNDTVVTKTVTLKNLSSNYDVSIVSDSGVNFSFDIGNPTLTCLVNGEENLDYTYSWAVIDNTNTFQSMTETTKLNAEYEALQAEYDTLQAAVAAEETYYEIEKDKLDSLKLQLDSLAKTTRVKQNKIYSLNVNTITNFSSYVCSVYYKKIFIGSASIVITNKLTAEGNYSLVINDSSLVFKYNESGISPASNALDSPIDLQALTYTLYDDTGVDITDKVNSSRYSIKWIVPTENTMLSIPSSYEASSEDAGTATYEGISSLAYSIADRYNITSTNNTIKLLIDYNGISLAATTNFTFIKEGEAGTNGTEFTCKIVPNVPNGFISPAYPTITELSDGSWSINYTTVNANVLFRAQLWQNEEKIFDSATSSDEITVEWSILKNKDDISSLEVDGAKFNYLGYHKSNRDGENVEAEPANIVQVCLKYNKVEYYATIPVYTVKISNDDYKVTFKENSGFKYATYTSDGKSPKYDNSNPFEVVVTKTIDDHEVNVTSLEGDEAVDYKWYICGTYYENKAWIKSGDLLNRKLDEIEEYQKSIYPASSYDGLCLSDGLECIISKDGAEVASIMIPVHLMLNRYGISAINSWNGNSVQIDDEGGCILSPQVGAGVKNSDNSFTGIVMGEVKETNQASANVGLLGYAEGKRSIFLDANTGTATFGVNGKGQIIIDPSDDKAELKSGNYSTSDKAGMLIDLTTPQIKFGSGNFSIDAEGKITAKGGGTIAGWNIADTQLYKGKVGISSNNSSDSNIAFWAGSTNAGSAPFRVDFNGNLVAHSGSIGNGSSKITIGGSGSNSAIYSGSKSSYDAGGSGFYLGVNGLSLGSNFFVDSSGNLTAKSGSFTGSIYSGNGTIGGWTIGTSALTSGSMSITSGGSISGANWSINSAGLASFSNINVSGGSIALGGTTLSASGTTLTANNTKVGNVSLNDHIKNLTVDKLVAGNLQVGSYTCNWQDVIVYVDIRTTTYQVLDTSGNSVYVSHITGLGRKRLHLLCGTTDVSD